MFYYMSERALKICNCKNNKDENVYIFALCAINGELLEREREKESVRERERSTQFGGDASMNHRIFLYSQYWHLYKFLLKSIHK